MVARSHIPVKRASCERQLFGNIGRGAEVAGGRLPKESVTFPGSADFAFQVHSLHTSSDDFQLTPCEVTDLQPPNRGFCSGPSRALESQQLVQAKGMVMKTAHTEMGEFQEFLERKESELVRVLQTRDDITIEKSADQMDEVQYASERDLAIRNPDRESNLLRQVRTALRRIHDGSYGTCIECEWVINPKRLAAVPWASRCIQCQEAADRDQQDRTESLGDTFLNAA